MSIAVMRATMHVVDIPLADGAYDAFVVWAEPRDDGALSIDLTITTGARKGDVVAVRAATAPRGAMELGEIRRRTSGGMKRRCRQGCRRLRGRICPVTLRAAGALDAQTSGSARMRLVAMAWRSAAWSLSFWSA
jgi:hypothetical protein